MNHRNDQQGRQRGAHNDRHEGRQGPSRMRQKEWREGQDDLENGRGNRDGEFQRGSYEQDYSARSQRRTPGYGQRGYAQGGQDRGQGYGEESYYAQNRRPQYPGEEEYGRWNEGRYAGQALGGERDDWQGTSYRGEEHSASRYPQGHAGGRDWRGYDQQDFGQDCYAGYGYGSAPQAGQYNPSPEDDYRPQQYWGGGESYGRTGRGPGGYASEYGYGGNNRVQAAHSYDDGGAAYDRGFVSDSQAYSASGYAGSQRTNHRGRGPKNYKRSDERLREDINEKLTEAPWLDASEINVHAKDGKVTIEGMVSNRQLKHQVEDLVDRCYGVSEIDNRLTIGNTQKTSRGQSANADNVAEEDNGQSKRGKTQQH